MSTEPDPAGNGSTPVDGERRAGVIGSPIEHSLSPVLHEAAYRRLGLTHWRYERFERDAEGLVPFVESLGPQWAGLSVTMPGKRAALSFAGRASDRADAVGAANTLVAVPDGWYADCTDVDGVAGALRAAAGFTGGRRALVLGAGGTADAAMVALADLGVDGVDLVVRAPARAADTVGTARCCGLEVRTWPFAEVDLRELAAGADVVISTLPGGAADAYAPALAAAPCLLDVVYDPWPTPLARAVAAAGGGLATGLDMLLHQSFGQVAQFTGREAPREAMRDALYDATGGELELPL